MIKELARQYGQTTFWRTDCKFSAQDQFEKEVEAFRLGLNRTQQEIFDDAKLEFDDPMDESFNPDDAWCKELKSKLARIVATLPPPVASASELGLSDQVIKDLAARYAMNTENRELCKFSDEDLFKADVEGLRPRMNSQQQAIFDKEVQGWQEAYGFGLHAVPPPSDYETWCKDARDKLRVLLGK